MSDKPPPGAIKRLIPLTEAFRAVVRVWYPARPALADEIQNEDYFRSPFDKSTGWRLNPEVQIADFAYAELKDAIINQQVRLRGRRETKDDAEDIDPTEIKRSGIFIFTNAVDRWQPTTRVSKYRQLPIYLNVHCYADEIAALIDLPLEAPAVPAPQMHYPGDAALIEKGVNMAAAGMTYRAIGRALAPDAEGPNTELESKEDRLRKAIAAEHKSRLGGR